MLLHRIFVVIIVSLSFIRLLICDMSPSSLTPPSSHTALRDRASPHLAGAPMYNGGMPARKKMVLNKGHDYEAARFGKFGEKHHEA